jgi:hypothetical protein
MRMASIRQWILMGSAISLVACASTPKGSAKIRAEKGLPSAVNYLTAEELEKDLRAKGGPDVEVEVRMLPKGGRIFYSSTKMKVSYSEQENTTPYLSITENEKEIRLCDDSDFNSKDSQASAYSTSDGVGVGAAVPLKSNKVEFVCDLRSKPAGDFEVRLLDSDKQVLERYFVSPGQ